MKEAPKEVEDSRIEAPRVKLHAEYDGNVMRDDGTVVRDEIVPEPPSEVYTVKFSSS